MYILYIIHNNSVFSCQIFGEKNRRYTETIAADVEPSAKLCAALHSALASSCFLASGYNLKVLSVAKSVYTYAVPLETVMINLYF